jgi:hypothetical protein
MHSPHVRHPDAALPRADIRPRARWDGGCRLVCMLTTLHPERALSRALVQHLSHEMPDIEFLLHDRPDLHVVWVCGYEPGAQDLVHALRLQHPDTFVVVTGRGPVEGWEEGVRAAGADYVCSWPIPYADLSRILHRSRLNSRVPAGERMIRD